MPKLLHTADIHLDSPLRSLALRDPDLRDRVQTATRSALMRIVDTAVNESVAAVLIAGDLFDGKVRSARTGAFLTGQMDRLRAAGIKVFYIKGNHDAENPVTGSLDLPDNVHVFDARGGRVQLTDDVWIHGVSFADRHAPDSLLSRFGAPVDGAVNVAMMHSSLAGAPGHDVYAPCAVADLMGMGFDYWALGHIHQRKIHATAPWIVMPGTPQGRDIGETGAKSASLLHIDDGRIEVSEIPTSAVEFLVTTLDVTDVGSDDDLRGQLRGWVRSVTPTSAARVVRLTLTGTPDRHWQILRDRAVWTETLRDIAQEADDLWIDKLRFDLSAPRDTAATDAVDEMARSMQAILSEPGFTATATAAITEVLDDLPPQIRARLLPTEDAARDLCDRLSRDGAQRMLARMKGTDA